MAILITLKSLRLNGEIVQPGTKIRFEDGTDWVDKGYARRLEEPGTILILQPLPSGGVTIPPGTKIQFEVGQGLIDKGYARRLAQEECREILDEWVEEARQVFGSVTLVEVVDVFMPDGRHCIKVISVSEDTGERRSVFSQKKAMKRVKIASNMKDLFEDSNETRVNGT
jgi:hypothetical protein